MNIIQHDPGDEYRVDILIDGRQVDTVHFTADGDVSATARGIVTAHGGNYGDVYQNDGIGGASYYETVEVQ